MKFLAISVILLDWSRLKNPNTLYVHPSDASLYELRRPTWQGFALWEFVRGRKKTSVCNKGKVEFVGCHNGNIKWGEKGMYSNEVVGDYFLEEVRAGF